MVELRLADIQAMIITGYGHLTYSTYMFLHVADGPKARAWQGSSPWSRPQGGTRDPKGAPGDRHLH
jgi:hypothetical protein